MKVIFQDYTWNDWKIWSAQDVDDLRSQAADGVSLEEAALHLGRTSTKSEVAAKARELGLKFRSTSAKPDKTRNSSFH
jgi:hypothetical protein